MTNSPAEILRAYLVAAGLAQLPTSPNPTWPAFVGNFAPTPDQAMCVYDTSGRLEGRIQATGETIEKTGWQVRARAVAYQTGWQKLDLIRTNFVTVQRDIVNIGVKSYLVHAITITSPIISLGQEEGKTRTSFTLNGLLTITEIMS